MERSNGKLEDIARYWVYIKEIQFLIEDNGNIKDFLNAIFECVKLEGFLTIS
jgi:hypothetical protein